MLSQVGKMLVGGLSVELRTMSAHPIFWIKLIMFFKGYIWCNLAGILSRKVKICPSEEVHTLCSVMARFHCIHLDSNKCKEINLEIDKEEAAPIKKEQSDSVMCEIQKHSTSGRWCQHKCRHALTQRSRYRWCLVFGLCILGWLLYFVLCCTYFLKMLRANDIFIYQILF